MGSRVRLFRTGLLIITILLGSGIRIFSQDTGSIGENQTISPVLPAPGMLINIPVADAEIEEESEILEIYVESTPASPIINSPWTLVIMVNYSNPSFVNVRPPELPPTLVMDSRVRVEPRIFREERWTRFEYIFYSQTAGTIRLDPFIITVPDLQAETNIISVSFREAPVVVRRYDPRFRWAGTAPPVYTGSSAELVLELIDWNPDLAVPRGLFQGRTPLNAIVSEGSPVLSSDGIYRYAINVIPLEGEIIVLDAFSFRSDIHTLSVPVVRIPVLETEFVQEIIEEEEEDIIADVYLPFPRPERNIFFPLEGIYQRTLNVIEELWEENRRAEALAIVRRNERESVIGVFLPPLRSEMEQLMGLRYSDDEYWRPLNVHPLSWMVSFIIIIFTIVFLIFFRRRFRSGKSNPVFYRNIKNSFIFILLLGFLLIIFEEGIRKLVILPLFPGQNAVILERTAVHRIPDYNAGINAYFPEGQPVTVGDLRGEWRYVESSDGRSGWILDMAVIKY